MTRDDSLNILSELSTIIGKLELAWPRPRSEAERAIIRSLLDIRETIRKAHEARHNLDTQPMNEAHLARFCADISLYVGHHIYFSPAAQQIEVRHDGAFRRAQNGTWLFLSHRILTPLQRQCLESDLATLDCWIQGKRG